MPNNLQRKLNNLVEKQAQLLVAAEAGDWQQTLLEYGKNDQQIRSLLLELKPTSGINTYKKTLEHLLAIHQRLEQLSQQQRANLQKELGNLHQGQKAIDLYHSI